MQNLTKNCLSVCSMRTHQAHKYKCPMGSQVLPVFQTYFELGYTGPIHYKDEQWQFRSRGDKVQCNVDQTFLHIYKCKYSVWMNNFDFTQVLVGSSWGLYWICCQETNKTQNKQTKNKRQQKKHLDLPRCTEISTVLKYLFLFGCPPCYNNIHDKIENFHHRE